METMTKWFNVKGPCIAQKHYMVDISDRLEKMKRLVDREEYFVINRGRQYGKTTTIAALETHVTNDYLPVSLNFQGFGTTSFLTEEKFCQKLTKEIKKNLQRSNLAKDAKDHLMTENIYSFDELSDYITVLCEERKVVLIIDEVDRASNYRVFLDFLGMLRAKYHERSGGKDFTFHSVILVGVYDIKNIKLRMIKAGVYQPGEGANANESPWNIAENFDEPMEFSPIGISGMLENYEADHQTGMDIVAIAEEIYAFTSGYPFLVSRICQYIDEKLDKNWTKEGVLEAVQLITEEPQPSTLFDDLFKNIRNQQGLSDFLYEILMEGKIYKYSLGDEVIEQGMRYAFIRVVERNVRIHNKIFEIIITAYFISKEKREGKKLVPNSVDAEVVNGEQFNIELFFEKFNAHYQREYAKRDVSFLEREATFLFLFFLQPYLNGKGFYYPQTQPNHATGKRMDVVVTYGNEEFIIELKVWRGRKYQADAYKQLVTYMNKRDAKKGYLLTFDFRQKKEIKQEWIKAHGMPILEVQV